MSDTTYQPSDASSGALIGSSLISVLSLLVVIFSFLRWRRLRRHPSGLIAMRSVIDCCFCIVLVFSHLFRRGKGIAQNDCGGLTFVTQFLAIGAEVYGALLSVDLVLGLSNPFTNFKRNARIFHLSALVIALALSLPLLLARSDADDHALYGRDNYLAICWLRTTDAHRSVSWEFYAFFGAPVAGMYAFALLALAFAQRRLRQGLPETFEARMSMFRSSFRFVISYSLYWATAAAVVAGIHVADDEAPPEALDLVLAFALGSRGIVTCAVWLSTYGQELRLGASGLQMPPKEGDEDATPSRARGASFSGRVRAAAAEFGFYDEDAAQRPYLTNALRKEILYYTSLGIARGALHGMRDKGVDEVRRDGIALNRFKLSRQWEERGLFSLEVSKRSNAGASAAGWPSPSASRLPPVASPSWFSSVFGSSSAQRSALQESLLRLEEDASSNEAMDGLARNPSMRLLQRAANAEGVSISMPSPRSIPRTATEPGSLSAAEQSSVEFESATPMPTSPRSPANWVFDVGAANSLNGVPHTLGSGTGLGQVGDVNEARDASRRGATAKNEDDSRGATKAIASLLRAFLKRSSSTDALDRQSNAKVVTAASTDANFGFVDYEPHLFERMRAIVGITTLDYVQSLSRTSRERFSEGASGAFLYFSTCERFIVKTLSAEECETLLSMLHDLKVYVERHPHSLITRFYGLHSITMYGHTMYFVVMQNVLQSSGSTIHERYDLKGSWVNRHRVPIEHGHKATCRYCGQKFRSAASRRRREKLQCPARPNQPHEANTVLRDADWNNRLRLEQGTAQALGDMIVTDSEFLRRHGIMDYSLLLGIHRNKYKLVDSSTGRPAAPPAASASGDREGDCLGQSTPSDAPGPVLHSLRHESSVAELDARGMGARAAGGHLLASLRLQRYDSPALSPMAGSSADVPALDGEGSLDGPGHEGMAVGSEQSVGRLVLASPAPGFSPAFGATPVPTAQDDRPIQLRLDLEAARKRGAVTPFFAEYKGGMRAIIVEGPGVYYMGIIDVLQRWTWSKWIERKAKILLLCLSKGGVSTCPPDAYAARFRTRVIAQLVEGYEWKEEDQREQDHHHAWEEDDFGGYAGEES